MNNSKIEPAVNNLIRDGKTVPYYLNDGIIRTFAILITILCCILTAVVYHSSFEGSEPIEYPLQGSITQYDPYVQQFDENDMRAAQCQDMCKSGSSEIS